MRKNTDRYVLLTVSIHQEGKHFLSKCEDLGTASFGDTIDEALANLKDAVLLHLNTLEYLGDRERVFKERRIKVFKNETRKPRSIKVSIQPGTWSSRISVPVCA